MGKNPVAARKIKIGRVLVSHVLVDRSETVVLLVPHTFLKGEVLTNLVSTGSKVKEGMKRIITKLARSL